MPVRKLVAIVMADVVGYSRLMERDEAGTHARLRELRGELVDPKIAEHRGRTVQTSGDGMLLEFPSATSALRCAVEVQRALGVRNLYLGPDERIELRIGINLGDIIVEGEDVIGDAVNIAQRLENLAEPGGICVAAAVQEQVHEDLGIEFVDIGKQRVKNISKPIHVYRIALAKGAGAKAEPGAAGSSPAESTRPRPRRRTQAVTGVAALAVLGAWAAWQFRTPPAQVATATGSAPMPRSVMVAPFKAPTGDGELLSLASTLTSDISRTLADTLRDVAVVPFDAGAYVGSAAENAGSGRKLKARLLLEGDVRATGDDVTVIARLIDAEHSRQLGSDRVAIARDRLAQDQELLTVRLQYAIRELFETAERRRTAAPLPPNATATELVQRAQTLLDIGSEDLSSLREIRSLYDRAIERDPLLAAAWSGRTNVAFAEFLQDYKADRERLLAEMDRDSLRAIQLDDRDPAAWNARHQALQFQSRFDAALAASDRARALDPGHYYFLRGFLYIFSGRADEALRLAETRHSAIGRAHPVIDTMSCDAHLHLGNYAQAIADCERAAAGNDGYWDYLNLTAAYAQAGDAAKAAAAKAELKRRVPDFTIGRYQAKRLSTDPTWVRQTEEHVVAGWRKAGVPE